MAERDPLTGIANRRGLERFAADLPQQGNPPLCVAYFDLDGFKEVNDTHGHATGDALLVGVADLLCENIRRVDFVGRLGGDGFVVCMPAVWPSDGHMVSKRLRRVIANHAFATPSGPIRIDCSVGVSAMRSPDDRLPDAIARADAALYAAKSAGRGRVVMESAATSAIGDGTDRRSRHGTVADDALETGDPETVAANLSHR